MSLQIILAGNKRTNIYDRSYDRSKRRFNIYERSRDLSLFIFTAFLNTLNHRSLYNCHEPNTIDEIALDTTRRTSIYQRVSITDHMALLASDLGKYYKF